MAKTHSQLVTESQKRHPDRHSARVAVSEAIKQGKLKKASSLLCVDCGGNAKEYDHPRGYSKENWLFVDSVCKSCHVERGVARGEYSNGKPIKRKVIGGVIKKGRSRRWNLGHSKDEKLKKAIKRHAKKNKITEIELIENALWSYILYHKNI